MPEERLSDALKTIPSQPEPQKDPKNHKMAKRVAYGAAGLAIVAGIGASVINHDDKTTDKRPEPDRNAHARDTEKEKQQDPYKNLSKQKIQVEAADKAVTAMVKDKTAITENRDDKPSDETLNKDVQTADDKVNAIQGNDEGTKSVRTAYTDIINVVKDPSLDKLQTAKTDINNMKNANLSQHINDKNIKSLTKVVATVNHMSVSDVENATKPLTAQQQQAKAAAAAKAKADAEAKARSAAQAAQRSAQSTNQASAQNTASAQSSSTYQTQSNYQAPAQNTAPAQSTQRSTAPANNTQRYSAPARQAPAPQQHAASNNQAAQQAASSAQIPADAVDTGHGLTGANGEPLNLGGW